MCGRAVVQALMSERSWHEMADAMLRGPLLAQSCNDLHLMEGGLLQYEKHKLRAHGRSCILRSPVASHPCFLATHPRFMPTRRARPIPTHNPCLLPK